MAKKQNAAHFGPGGTEFKNRLDQLFQVDGPEADKEAIWIDRDKIEPDPEQPRRYFPEDQLIELGASIRTVGQIQAILVRPHPDPRKAEKGIVRIVIGERRWRSTDPYFDGDLGPVPKLRAISKKMTDYEAARLQIDENEKRDDGSVIVTARGYKRLYDTLFSKDSSKNARRWDEIARQVGTSTRNVFHIVALLDLPEAMQRSIEEKQLTALHGRALVNLAKYPTQQKVLFRQILREEISGKEAVRRASQFKKDQAASESTFKAPEPPVDESTPAESTEDHPLKKGDEGASTPAPATSGTGMADATEPVRKPPLTERREALRKSLVNALGRLDEAAAVIPDLAGARRFQEDIEEVLADITKSVREIRKGMK